MEFKGSKGKWEVSIPEDSNGFIYVGGGQIATCYTVDYKDWEQSPTQETKANAILISKAPEMLEMLKEILYGDLDPKDVFKKAEQLIKEATEL